MATYVFAYRASASAEARPETADEWRSWLGSLDSVGNLKEWGNPVFDRESIGDCGPETVLGGYSFITAESLEDAVELAGGCPAIAHGGGVEVGEITFLTADHRVGELKAAASR